MTPQELSQLRVLVVGAGVTGASVMRYLLANDVAFDVTDGKATPSDKVRQLLNEGAYVAGLDEVNPSNYDVMVLSPGIPRAHPMIKAALAAGVSVIGDIELFASVVKGDVIAITGSNGKSTVASMAAHVLKQCGRQVELCGNIGTAVLDVLPKPTDSNTEVGQHSHRNQEKNSNAMVYVLELSSYQLESLQRLSPLSAVVLNISEDHLDRYDSIEHYAAVKRHVYSNANYLVANADDERTHPEANTNNTLWFSSTNEKAKFSLKNLANQQVLCVDDQAVITTDDLQVPGEHNVANALAVMALLHPLQLTLKQLKLGLSSFHGLEHRTQLVAEVNGVRWYNDSKGTNVDACIKAIQAMPGAVVLIAGGQGKGVDFAPLRPVVSERVKAVVLMGEDAPKLRATLEGASELFDVSSMHEAVELSKQLAENGDVVLLSPACASFDMFENYQARGRLFCESVEQAAA